MPLPIIPFAIKGAIVVFKLLASKGVLAKTTIVASKAVSTYGVAATATAAVAGAAVIGGIVWTKESIERATDAYELYLKSDKVGAAKELASLALSIKCMGSNDIASDIQSWIDAGKPIHGPEFGRLVLDASRIAKEANRTANS